METQSFMQCALGDQWEQLPDALKAHYREDKGGRNKALGNLTIDYPSWMQIPLNIMRLFGALINRKGDNLSTQVSRKTNNGRQYWHRQIHFKDQSSVEFNSQFFYLGKNEFIEYTNRFLGLKMAVCLIDKQLHYDSRGYVIQLGQWQLPFPEILALGHATIVESANADGGFNMDFRLTHPIFGEIFSYRGSFSTTLGSGTK